ncbi:MAG: tripartite tricarboxylate transporter permease [Chloroflexi bacterium]|nr:tripartite tricarboxylate transporter permease [Chloroflexota bacterium]
MSEITEALANLGNPVYWIAVTVAVLIAAVTGIIPGASGVLIMALSIPFIVEFFRDDPAIGLVMLASMTGVNNTLDSIPAILLGQPGAATQVTFLEGHQLARQGKAAHTLGAVYGVSMFGGIVGAVVLAALIPIIKPFVLSFGFPEIAAMAFFGIAMVSALSTGAMVKGLAAGALGILLGTVGINPITGDVRYVFQQPALWSGLPLIATTLGLFALPEMLDLSMARRSVAPPDAVISTAEVWRGTKYGLSQWRVMIRQSLFGVLMGAIPGVGAAVIDWLAYAFGIFFTKDKSQFGKGSLDGVLFAESAQNSKEAGQAIPTLALGVPGGLAWAIVLIAMVAMDVTPGPQMLGRFADVTILLVITLAIGNVMVTGLGILATGQLAKLTRLPYPIIGGVIIPIAFLTGVVNMTNWLAIPIMLTFMGIGLIMKLFQWPRPPLLLGVILGPVIELNFQSAVNIHGAIGVVTRPLSIVLVVIAVLSAYFFWRSGKKQAADTFAREDAENAAAGISTEPAAPVSLMGALIDVKNIPILLMVGGGMAMYASAGGFTPTAAFLPKLMSGGVIFLSLLQLFFHLKNRTSRRSSIMDLGMLSLTAPGFKAAAIIVSSGLFGFVMISGFVGLRYGALALAAWLPIMLMNNRLRWVGVAVAVFMVFMFEFVMADNLLFIIWPEAAFPEWINREILGN